MQQDGQARKLNREDALDYSKIEKVDKKMVDYYDKCESVNVS